MGAVNIGLTLDKGMRLDAIHIGYLVFQIIIGQPYNRNTAQIAKLLEQLNSENRKAVAACDFEEEL